jgi:hypothetical protein
MSVLGTAAMIAAINITCCIAFIVFKTLLFYDYFPTIKLQYEINWISTTHPTAFGGEIEI